MFSRDEEFAVVEGWHSLMFLIERIVSGCSYPNFSVSDLRFVARNLGGCGTLSIRMSDIMPSIYVLWLGRRHLTNVRKWSEPSFP